MEDQKTRTLCWVKLGGALNEQTRHVYFVPSRKDIRSKDGGTDSEPVSAILMQ